MVQRQFGVTVRREQTGGRICQIQQQLLEPELKHLVCSDEEVLGRPDAWSLLWRNQRMLCVQDFAEVQVPGIGEGRLGAGIHRRWLSSDAISKSSASRSGSGTRIWRPKRRI